MLPSKSSILIWRSSHESCSMKKDVLRNFTKSTGKYLCQRFFFNKVAGLRLPVINYITECYILDAAAVLDSPLIIDRTTKDK